MQESVSHSTAGVHASLLYYLHACPICKRDAQRHYCRVPSLYNAHEFITYDRCTVCGTVFRNPRLPDDYRLWAYEERPSESEPPQLEPATIAHARYMLGQLQALLQVSSPPRLLDFGCGAGGFLRQALEAGFDVMGLEVNKALVAHVSSQYGIPTFQGLITDPGFKDERFDVIVSSQVFEHLLDPSRTLKAVQDHLNPNGLLLIEVPNLSHFRERLKKGSTMDDAHLFYFNRRSLSDLLTGSGFHIVRVEEGLRPFRFTAKLARPMTAFGVSLWERFFSLCQVKTSLSIIARLQSSR